MVKSATPASVAMISLLFIVVAIAFGFCVYRRNMPMGIASVIGVLAIVAIMAIGMNFHPIYLSTKTWMWIVGLYIAIASVTPVWILLQPRDYLSSFLLYAMLGVAVFGVIVAHPTFDSSFPAFGGFAVEMEGAAIGQAAYLNHIPFLVVRAISDKADGSAHMDYAEFEMAAIEHSVKLTVRMIQEL